MAKKRSRSNGDGDVFPRKNKDGKIIGYRSYGHQVTSLALGNSTHPSSDLFGLFGPT
jgi:hypothetical protein